MGFFGDNFDPGKTDGQPVEKLNSGNAVIDGIFNGLVSFGAVIIVTLFNLIKAVIDALTPHN